MGKRTPFKFTNILTKLPQFTSTVSYFWENTDPLFLSTSVLFRLSKKFKVLKPILCTMGKEKLGDLPRRNREAHYLLCYKHAETLLNPSPRAMEEEATAYDKWQLLSELEEAYLKQKAKIHWLTVRD